MLKTQFPGQLHRVPVNPNWEVQKIRKKDLAKEEKVHARSKGDTEKAGEEDGTADWADRFSSQILPQNASNDAGEDGGKHLKTRWIGKTIKRL